MSNLQTLIQNIEQLSPENQIKVAEYVAFLQWQAGQGATPQDWSYSLIEAFKSASINASQDPAGMDVKIEAATVGGVTQPALWAHPPVAGQAIVEYYVPIPQQVQRIRLSVSFGIRDGAKIAPENLVAFGVRANGLRVWGEQTNIQQWQTIDIPLNLPSGDIARIELTTETLGSHEWTWAVWGQPELVGM